MPPKVQGYLTIVHPDNPLVEVDTITCAHCQRIEPVKSESLGLCRLCYANICGPCVDLGECVPFERKLDEMESKDQLRRALFM